jgi:hypothetical protein
VNRAELEHLIRAASTIANDDLVIVGSQAVLGAVPDAPRELLRSMEADMYPVHNPAAADEIDGAIGDGSQFHAAFGIYAHGVGPETVIAPRGWEQRLVRVEVRSGGDDVARVGWCLELHDLLLAKLAAGRERDWEFVEVAIRHDLATLSTLHERAELVPASDRERVRAALEGVVARAGR